MILKEFIKESQKNQMISTLLKYYKVETVKWKYKKLKDHAYYNVDKGILEFIEAAHILHPSYPEYTFIISGQLDESNPSHITKAEVHK